MRQPVQELIERYQNNLFVAGKEYNYSVTGNVEEYEISLTEE